VRRQTALSSSAVARLAPSRVSKPSHAAAFDNGFPDPACPHSREVISHFGSPSWSRRVPPLGTCPAGRGEIIARFLHNCLQTVSIGLQAPFPSSVIKRVRRSAPSLSHNEVDRKARLRPLGHSARRGSAHGLTTPSASPDELACLRPSIGAPIQALSGRLRPSTQKPKASLAKSPRSPPVVETRQVRPANDRSARKTMFFGSTGDERSQPDYPLALLRDHAAPRASTGNLAFFLPSLTMTLARGPTPH